MVVDHHSFAQIIIDIHRYLLVFVLLEFMIVYYPPTRSLSNCCPRAGNKLEYSYE